MQRVGFVLLPGFGLLSLAGAVDVLAAANGLLAAPQRLLPGAPHAAAGAPSYQALLLGERAMLVASSGGVAVAVQPWDGAGALDAVFVVAEQPWRDELAAAQAPLLAWLRQQAGAGRVLGGIGSGAMWLAAAGLLRGHRATVHWPHVATLAERHPELLVSQQLYEIDRERLSCAGHQASRDLAIAWLGQRHGERVARELAALLGLERVRDRDERQRLPLAARLAAQVGGGSAKLAEAVSLMEANLAEPLPTEEIARLVGVSRRQLERLFKQHLDALPSRWYLSLRLERARRLLRQTSQSVLQIGLGCGFASGPHFSNAYRAHFGHTPRDERSPRAAAWRAGAELPTAPAAPTTTEDPR